MKFEHKNRCIGPLKQFILNNIPTEPQERNLSISAMMIAFYAIDYIIAITLFLLTKLNYHPQLPQNLIYISVIITVTLNLLYLISKFRIFLFLNKLNTFIHCFLFPIPMSPIYISHLPLNIIVSIIWVFSIEKKILHFDSRLLYRYPLLKSVSMNIFVIIALYTQIRNDSNMFYALLLAFALSWLVIDSLDLIYQTPFKKMMTCTDCCLIVSSALALANPKIGGKFVSTEMQITLILINVLSCGLIVWFSIQNYSILFQIQPQRRSQLSDRELITYFFTLDRLIAKGTELQKLKFMFFHIRQCEDSNCFLKYYYEKHKKTEMTLDDVLTSFIFEEMITFAKKIRFVNNYLIYRAYEKPEIIYQHIDKTDFFHERQYRKLIVRISKTSEDIVIMNIEKIIDCDCSMGINHFVDASLKFWRELLEINIDIHNLVKYSCMQIEEYMKIKKIVHEKTKISENNRVLANSFLHYLCLEQNNQIECQLTQNQQYLSQLMEAPPTILVSAEKETFLQIIDVNIATLKYSGFTRKELMGLTIDNLWHEDLRPIHVDLVYRRSKQSKFSSGQYKRSYAFIKNRFGYLVFVDGFVYYVNDIDGKKWCVVLKPYLPGQAVFVCNVHRKLVGINDYCTYLGMGLELEGKTMSNQVFENTRVKKSGSKLTKQRNKKIFEDHQFTFSIGSTEVVSIKFISDIIFDSHLLYHAFTVSKRVDVAKVSKNAKFNYQEVSLAHEELMVDTLRKTLLYRPQFQFRVNFGTGVFVAGMKNVLEVKCKENLSLSPSLSKKEENLSLPKKEQNLPLSKKDEYEKEESEEHKEVKVEAVIREVFKKYFYEKEEIIEMRLWKNELDFIQNINQQDPHEFNETLMEPIQKKPFKPLTFEQFKQNMPKRFSKNRRLTYLLRLYFLLIVIGIIAISLSFNFLIKTSNSKFINEFQISNLLGQQYENMIVLGHRTIARYYDRSVNVTYLIEKQVNKVEEVYKNLTNLNEKFTDLLKIKMTHDLTIESIENEYRLLLNQYLNDPNLNETNVVNYLIKYVYPSWDYVLEFYQNQRLVSNNEISYYEREIFLGASAAFIVLLGFFYYQIVKSIKKKVWKIADIFRIMHEDYIEAEIVKVLSFKKHLDFGNNLLELEEIGDFVTHYEEPCQYRKKLVHNFKMGTPTIFMLIYFLLFFFFCAVSIIYANQSKLLFNNHIQLVEHSRNVSIQAHMIWIGLNSFPRNIQAIDFYEERMYEADRLYQLTVYFGFEKNYYSENLQEFFQNFSYRSSCRYFNVSQCKTEINGAIQEGAKQMYAYMFRKYDWMMHTYHTPQQFQGLSSAKTLYHLHLFYLQKMGSMIHKQLQQEQKRKTDNLNTLILQLLLGFSIISMIIAFLILSRTINQIEKVDKIFDFIPFEYFKENEKFNDYFNHKLQ